MANDSALGAPVASRNLSPLYANLGIPVMTSAEPLERGAFDLQWTLHWASHSVFERENNEFLSLDGETRRQDLRVQAGLGKGIMLSLNVPYISHSGGQLDTFIDDWHAFWGMPDGPRALQPTDNLGFSYSGSPGFELNSTRSGIGDIEIAASLALVATEQWTVGVFAQYKFATGSVIDFSGSGEDGVSLGARWSRQSCMFAQLSCHLQGGLSEVGENAFDPNADTWVPFAGVSLGWQLGDSLALVAQLDAHDAVYQAKVLSANGVAVWGTLGLRWTPVNRWIIDAQFLEDLAVGTAPDISFRLALSRSF
ncbi:DUF3187 family protein [Congregibacter variabilis]|uniref:DUF3187 family protein n=1 Tax=Congregibacter variabilis TaxID=3081200 RepID=A0ABZ0I6U4_9GAMM|nr:DUF3187 family protein [Congregibacter sp. IMCC43200]